MPEKSADLSRVFRNGTNTNISYHLDNKEYYRIEKLFSDRIEDLVVNITITRDKKLNLLTGFFNKFIMLIKNNYRNSRVLLDGTPYRHMYGFITWAIIRTSRSCLFSSKSQKSWSKWVLSQCSKSYISDLLNIMECLDNLDKY